MSTRCESSVAIVDFFFLKKETRYHDIIYRLYEMFIQVITVAFYMLHVNGTHVQLMDNAKGTDNW